MARGGPTIKEAALEIVHRRGPQSLDAIVPEIVAAGLTRAKDPRRAVIAAIDAGYELLRDWDGRYCSLGDQLEGTLFTHRMTSLERRDGIVILPSTLAPIERFVVKPKPFARGGDVHLHWVSEFFDLPWPGDLDDADGHPDDLEPESFELDAETADELTGFLREIGVGYEVEDDQAIAEFIENSRYLRLLDGPPGWLPVLAVDDLLGLRVRSGAIETVRVTAREVRGSHVGIVGAEIAKLARRVIGPDPSWFGPPALPIEELLDLVLTESPQLLHRPLPPFAVVVARGGLEVVDGLVGHRGTDWAALGYVPASSPQESWGFQPGRTIQ